MQTKWAECGAAGARQTGSLTTPGKLGMFHLGRGRPWEVQPRRPGGEAAGPLPQESLKDEEVWGERGSCRSLPPPQATDRPRLRVSRKARCTPGRPWLWGPGTGRDTVGPGKQQVGTRIGSWPLGRQGQERRRPGRGPARQPGKLQPGRDGTGGCVPAQTAGVTTLRLRASS